MRKIIFLLLMFSSLQLAAQYHPMLTQGKYWDVLHGDGTQLCFHTHGYRIFVNGDTLINNLNYTVLSAYQVKGAPGTPFCGPYSIDTNAFVPYIYLLREDSAAQKIFIYDLTSSNDALLYDFNLQPGDTLFSFAPVQVVVDSVGLITLDNGAIRKVVYVTGGRFYIESIGGEEGPADWLGIGLGFWSELHCVSENNTLLYHTFWGSGCLPVVNVDENAKERIEVFPNPATDYLQVSIANSGSMQLFNTEGDLIYSTFIQHDSGIDISNLKTGLYIYRLNIHDDYYYGKFVKE